VPATDAVGFHVAALRELFEEAGILLARDASGTIVPLTGDDAAWTFAALPPCSAAGSRS